MSERKEGSPDRDTGHGYSVAALPVNGWGGAVEVEHLAGLLRLFSQHWASYSRISLGSSFCEELLPAADEVSRAWEACSSHGAALAIVTPFVTDKGLKRVLEIAELARRSSLEVVVNDWGVLSCLSRLDIRLTAGRLLTRSKGDPRIWQVWERLPEARKAIYQRKPLLEERGREWTARFGVSAWEVDIPPWGIRNSEDAVPGIYCHQPFCYVSVSRWCPTRSALEGRKASSERCPRPCLDMAFRLTHNATGPLLQRGNAYFVKSGSMTGIPGATAVISPWFSANGESLDVRVV